MLALTLGQKQEFLRTFISLPDVPVSHVAMVNRGISQTWLCTIKLYHIVKFIKVNSTMQYSGFHFGNTASVFMSPTKVLVRQKRK